MIAIKKWILCQLLRRNTLANQIPGPKGYFIVGNLPTFINGPEKLIKNGLILCNEYSHKLHKFWLVNKLYICTSNAEDIEEIMNSSNCFKKPTYYSIISDTVSMEGIFTTSNYHDYKKNRKIISEWLKYSNIKLMIPTFYEETKVLDQILCEKSKLQPYEFDIWSAFNLENMDVIGRTAMGEELHAQKNEYCEFHNNHERLIEICEYRFHRPWYYNSSFFSLSSRKREQRTSVKFNNTFLNNLIDKKQIELKEKYINSSYDTDSIGQKHKNFIEILLKNDQLISRNEMRGELTTIIAAGHDTLAETNTMIAFMLAHHQDVQKNVFQEINSIFSVGDPDRPPTYEDLQKMEYLERVIKETMRLYPAAPIILRETEKEMSVGKYTIPADTTIVIPIGGLHLNPQYYSTPKKFDPDNFLPEACSGRHPYAYIPFSGGTRKCVGMKYAMLHMKTTISTLVRSFHFSPSEKCPTPKDLRISVNITMKFVDGCFIKIQSRK